MELLDEGKAVFRLRSRLCSSLYPVNEKIREFFAEYDRYVLDAIQPLGSELLEVCFSSCRGINSCDLIQVKAPRQYISRQLDYLYSSSLVACCVL